MKVQFTRPHSGGAMAGIAADTKIVEILATTDQATGAEIQPTVPQGSVQVADDAPTHDWQPSLPAFTR